MIITVRNNKNTKKPKSEKVKKLIFDVLDIIDAANIPLPKTDRAREKMATALLSVARVKDRLSEAKSIDEVEPLRTRDIINYEL